MKALGFIETRGLVAATEAADSALKAASVSLVGQKRPGSGLVTVIITGDVAAVKSAVDAGASSAAAVGEVVSVQVIARPHPGLEEIITEEPSGKGAGKKRAGSPKSPVKKTSSAQQNENPSI